MDKENVLVRVYELRDPRDIECKPRYVGITTKSLKYRLTAHKNCITYDYRGRWFKKLTREGVTPTIHLIEEVVGWDYACEVEKYWIKEFKEQGYNLTNSTEGGEGTTGYKHSQTFKNFQRSFRIGSKHSEETKRKISKTNKITQNLPEIQELRSKRTKGKKLSEETKFKISNSKKGIPCPEHVKQLLSVKFFKDGNPNYGKSTPETVKEKIRKLNSGELNWKYIRDIDRTLFIKHYLEGWTCKEIGEFYKIDFQLVYRYLKKNNVYTNKNRKKYNILQYDLEGNFIKEWNNILIKDIPIYFNKNYNTFNLHFIKDCKKSMFNYMWREKTDNYPLVIPAYRNKK